MKSEKTLQALYARKVKRLTKIFGSEVEKYHLVWGTDLPHSCGEISMYTLEKMLHEIYPDWDSATESIYELILRKHGARAAATIEEMAH
jgi:hypothetical protein